MVYRGDMSSGLSPASLSVGFNSYNSLRYFYTMIYAGLVRRSRLRFTTVGELDHA